MSPPEINPARRSQGSAGFTLIELIAVMVVIGILAGVAVPTLSSLDGSREAFVSRMLQRDLTYARQHAVATGTRTWVTFDAAGESWSLLEEDSDNPGRANASVMTDPMTGNPYTIDIDETVYAGVNLVSATFDGESEIGFDWLGRALNDDEDMLNADGTIVIGSSQTLTIVAGTGHLTRSD